MVVEIIGIQHIRWYILQFKMVQFIYFSKKPRYPRSCYPVDNLAIIFREVAYSEKYRVEVQGKCEIRSLAMGMTTKDHYCLHIMYLCQIYTSNISYFVWFLLKYVCGYD